MRDFGSKPVTNLHPEEIDSLVESVEKFAPDTTYRILQQHQQARLEVAARLLEELARHPVIGPVIRNVDEELGLAVSYVAHNAAQLTTKRLDR